MGKLRVSAKRRPGRAEVTTRLQRRSLRHLLLHNHYHHHKDLLRSSNRSPSSSHPYTKQLWSTTAIHQLFRGSTAGLSGKTRNCRRVGRGRLPLHHHQLAAVRFQPERGSSFVAAPQTVPQSVPQVVPQIVPPLRLRQMNIFVHR